MWDTAITLAIVAAAMVFAIKRLFYTPHCGGKSTQSCRRCNSNATGGEANL